jgi:hypothetical protein
MTGTNPTVMPPQLSRTTHENSSPDRNQPFPHRKFTGTNPTADGVQKKQNEPRVLKSHQTGSEQSFPITNPSKKTTERTQESKLKMSKTNPTACAPTLSEAEEEAKS